MPTVLTAAAYRASTKKGRKSKYGNVQVKYDGHTFDSKKECLHYIALKSQRRRGEISELRVHPRFKLIVVCMFDLKAITEVGVAEMDFSYVDRAGDLHVIDVKGMDNPLSQLKRKIVEANYGFKVELV